MFYYKNKLSKIEIVYWTIQEVWMMELVVHRNIDV